MAAITDATIYPLLPLPVPAAGSPGRELDVSWPERIVAPKTPALLFLQATTQARAFWQKLISKHKHFNEAEPSKDANVTVILIALANHRARATGAPANSSETTREPLDM